MLFRPVILKKHQRNSVCCHGTWQSPERVGPTQFADPRPADSAAPWCPRNVSPTAAVVTSTGGSETRSNKMNHL